MAVDLNGLIGTRAGSASSIEISTADGCETVTPSETCSGTAPRPPLLAVGALITSTAVAGPSPGGSSTPATVAGAPPKVATAAEPNPGGLTGGPAA